MLTTCLRHLSPTFTSVLPPHYRHHYRHYYRQKKYADIYTDKTVSTFSVHRPTAKLITFPKLSQKRESGERRKNRFTPYYIKEFIGKNGGDNIVEYQQLKRFIVQVEAISLCKLRQFHCADCGNFIVQVEAFSLCKLRIYHKKKWCSIPQNETPLT